MGMFKKLIVNNIYLLKFKYRVINIDSKISGVNTISYISMLGSLMIPSL